MPKFRVPIITHQHIIHTLFVRFTTKLMSTNLVSGLPPYNHIRYDVLHVLLTIF